MTMARYLLRSALRACINGGVALSVAALFAHGAQAQDAPADRVEHGRYLAIASDCVACHTAPGGKPFAGGLDLNTPFGTITASNITSDRATGIGSWTLQQFDAAVRHGKGPNGHLYPAMPYTAYARMTDADLADLWAYIRTVPAVSQKVVENKLPFPYNIRAALIVWNALFFDSTPFKPDSAKSDAVNRGAYLVEALAHCGICHTPKNAFGSDSGATYQGTSLQGWHAPDLTNNDHTGLGKWSAEDIVTYLRSGTNRYTASSGPMTEVIVNSTQHLTDADLQAIAAYFKALPARHVEAPQPLPATNAQVEAGRREFVVQCSACHTSSGQGVANMIPSLQANPAINAKSPDSLLNILLAGTTGPATTANPTGAAMPGFAWKLQDDQIANVLTYIRNSQGNAAPAVSTTDVAKARKALGAQPVVWH
ncbi:cytochrome c [Gluconacetobacter takamatsuzukensis]|uniref:Cytochrome c n=2 Tax=Gluconacetobacter takamatsuzukensis TaxID=1286190 RepID=A0A7W4KBS7_9PROT|nr:cytochrome c [Gluconacetobacter takamatsuzukensis]